MTDRTLSGLANEVAFDRDVGTEDAWWRDRIGDYLRDMPESDQEDADKRRSIRDRLLALAPHLHPSISRAAEWDQLLRDIKGEMEGGGDGQSATHQP